ncbi:putative ATP-binding cassette transporter [Reichenbachiella faecimaris]|uniref:Putative ATP-binding cassette transporter n=1 Tax=Reichenbachiella faecimaris TaxID=692418 RepID=A0A1W2GM59_REIFA|nr:cyclic peptide export ABC transporter [Reichenbachiella faecimaris]SMD37755.1 putative ATP-binding cassette transporter [Reichenbachiella faecimaris]
MKILKLLIQSSKLLFLVAVVASALTGICSSFLIKMVVESINQTDFDAETFKVQFFLLWLGYGVLAVVSSFVVSKLSQGIIHKLRVSLSTKILQASFQEIEFNQGKIFPILTEDIKSIYHGIDRMPSVTTGLATVLGVLGYIAYEHPTLSLAVLVLFASVFVLTKLSLKFIRRYQEKSRVLWNDIFKMFEGLTYGIKELTINKKFKNFYLSEVIEKTSKKQNQYLVKESVVVAIASKSSDMVLLFGMASLVVYIYASGFVEPSVFGEFLTLVLFIIAPLSTVAGWFSNLKRIEVALEQISSTGIDLEEATQLVEPVDLLEPESYDSIIELKNARHEYYNPDEDEHFELGPINTTIKKGELIFLLGGNGSGKTTLAKMIIGLYPPKEGALYYKDQKVDDSNREDYRNKFSATFVDSYLFDNVTLIDDESVIKRSEQLLKTLEMTKKVKIENGKFSTTRLSEGQKKRLGLINAILKDTEIYLFDEWAANQDPHFKKIFYEIILQDLKKAGKTIIVISHDEQYFDKGDRVIKLMEGQLV